MSVWISRTSGRNRDLGVPSGELQFSFQACVWSPLATDWRLRVLVDLARRSGTTAACRRSRLQPRLGRRFGVKHSSWTSIKRDLPPLASHASTIASATRPRLNESACLKGQHPSSAPLSNLPPQLPTDDFRLLPMLPPPNGLPTEPPLPQPESSPLNAPFERQGLAETIARSAFDEFGTTGALNEYASYPLDESFRASHLLRIFLQC